MMKKLLTTLLTLSLLSAAALPALAAGSGPSAVISPGPEVMAPASEEDLAGLAIEVDGQPVNVRACVMVPLRAVAEKLGFAVAWDNGTVTVTGSGRYLRMTLGKDQYFAAPTQEGMMGASLFSLGCAPYGVGGVTYVPLELFDVLLGNREGAVTVEKGVIKINTAPENGGGVQIPNPFTGHATLEEAAGAVGFGLTAPEKADGQDRRDIQTMGEEMIQVFYGDSDICIRKASGSGDISGDYTAYAQVSEVTVEGISVTMKGADGLVHLAIWSCGGYTYSILARAGISGEDMAGLVRSVK